MNEKTLLDRCQFLGRCAQAAGSVSIIGLRVLFADALAEKGASIDFSFIKYQ